MNAPKTWKDYLKLFCYFLKEAYQCSKVYVFLSIAIMLIQTVQPFMLAYYPALLMDELIQERRMNYVIGYIVVITLSNSLDFVIHSFSKKKNQEGLKLNLTMEMKVALSVAQVPYDKLEDSEYLNFRQVYQNGLNRSSRMDYVLNQAFKICSYVFTILGYLVLLASLWISDRKIVKTGNLLLDFFAGNTWIWFLGIGGMSIYAAKLKTRADQAFTKMIEEFAPVDRAYAYYEKLSRDQECAKDIRLFHMFPLLNTYIEEYRHDSKQVEIKLSRITLHSMAPANLLLKLQTLLIYLLVTFKVYVKAITCGQFYLYANVIRNVILSLTSLLETAASVHYAFGFHYAYKALVEQEKEEDMESHPVPEKFESLEFLDVWFRYPGNENWILQGFSSVIHKGERVSIVGINGAGKTTLIKLLHRFYRPDKGKILLNGIDINEFSQEEYYKIFSTVFQDVHYWAYSIAENIASGSAVERSRAEKLLQQTGLYKICAQHQGLDTPLTHYFSSDGIQLSGGEAQKLAIARAFYKDAPVYVFDEPTAALDPLAEKEIVNRFHTLAKNKTVIYISHRMASCRFSDRIFVIEQGKLAECGSHAELLKENGLYAKLWNAQAQWYQ